MANEGTECAALEIASEAALETWWPAPDAALAGFAKDCLAPGGRNDIIVGAESGYMNDWSTMAIMSTMKDINAIYRPCVHFSVDGCDSTHRLSLFLESSCDSSNVSTTTVLPMLVDARRMSCGPIATAGSDLVVSDEAGRVGGWKDERVSAVIWSG